jgi:hypothetical protein
MNNINDIIRDIALNGRRRNRNGGHVLDQVVLSRPEEFDQTDWTGGCC